MINQGGSWFAVKSSRRSSLRLMSRLRKATGNPPQPPLLLIKYDLSQDKTGEVFARLCIAHNKVKVLTHKLTICLRSHSGSHQSGRVVCSCICGCGWAQQTWSVVLRNTPVAARERIRVRARRSGRVKANG